MLVTIIEESYFDSLIVSLVDLVGNCQGKDSKKFQRYNSLFEFNCVFLGGGWISNKTRSVHYFSFEELSFSCTAGVFPKNNASNYKLNNFLAVLLLFFL